MEICLLKMYIKFYFFNIIRIWVENQMKYLVIKIFGFKIFFFFFFEMSNKQIFPISKVKEIAMMDPDLKDISKKGIDVLRLATEQFSKYLIQKCFEESKKKKKITCTIKEFYSAIQNDDALNIFLNQFLINEENNNENQINFEEEIENIEEIENNKEIENLEEIESEITINEEEEELNSSSSSEELKNNLIPVEIISELSDFEDDNL